MTALALNTWQEVRDELLGRINSRRWKPGELIPNEADLAEEFGCARTTVNRALREIAESGLLERRRKAGTRVALFPVRKATFSIPIIRQEIEDRNEKYAYVLVSRSLETPPASVRAQMALPGKGKALHIVALHLANATPYVCEDRWVNVDAIPEVLDIDFDQISANEWLIAHAPFTRGDISFSAVKCDEELAGRMNTVLGDALPILSRTTWNGETAITLVDLTFRAGHRLHTSL